MMQIFVSGRELEIPADISFDFTLENRLLHQTDGYSLSIDLPLRDSAVNSEVFGIVWVPEADIYSVRFPASIITPQVALHGAVAIVGVSEKSISIQFLEGRSRQNSEKGFEENYINELDLGGPSLPLARRLISPDNAIRKYGEKVGSKTVDAIALPWVIRDSGEMVHNAVALKNNILSWAPSWNPQVPGREDLGKDRVPKMDNLSYMPYLLTVAIRVTKAMGYGHDFSQWEDDPDLRNIVVCNTIPASLRLRDFSWVLPHWTVNEFFENIEMILGGEFDFDHERKIISFRFTDSILDQLPVVAPDMVVDDFEVEIDPDFEDKDAALPLTSNIGYADNSSRTWGFQSCDWFLRRRLLEAKNREDDTRADDDDRNYHRVPSGEIFEAPFLDDFSRLRRFETLSELLDFARNFKYTTAPTGYPFESVMFAEDVKSYFIFRELNIVKMSADYKSKNPDAASLTDGFWYYVMNVMQVDQFGDFIVANSDDASRIELKTVPAPFDLVATDHNVIFLPYSADESIEDDEGLKFDPDDQDTYRKPAPYREIEAGDGNRHEYYDKLYVGFWKGGYDWKNLLPVTSGMLVHSDFSVARAGGRNMRLNVGFKRPGARFLSMDESKLYKFSWLSDSLPSARSLFMIKGKKYICSKINAVFSASGMSRLLKGEFYRL